MEQANLPFALWNDGLEGALLPNALRSHGACAVWRLLQGLGAVPRCGTMEYLMSSKEEQRRTKKINGN